MSKLFHECALHIDTEDAVPHVGRACAAVSATAAAARRRNRHRPATTTRRTQTHARMGTHAANIYAGALRTVPGRLQWPGGGGGIYICAGV